MFRSHCAPLGRIVAIFALATIFGARESRAVIVGIEFFNRGFVNPEFAGGPLWQGYVDTTANTLTIEKWTELPLHGADYWIPKNLPQVWPARNSSGGLFDVPDSFDGHIDGTFAFISNLTLRDIPWQKAVFVGTNPPVLDHLENVSYTLNTGDVYPGWGGYAYQKVVDGQIALIYATSNPDHTTEPDNSASEPAFDERIMPALPTSATSYVWARDSIVTASSPSVTGVPEASAWAMLSVVGGCLLALGCVRWFKT